MAEIYDVALQKFRALKTSDLVAGGGDVPMKSLVDEASTSVTYVCEAPVGTATSAAAWRVQRITKTGNVTLTEFAGTGIYDQVADNRAVLAYA